MSWSHVEAIREYTLRRRLELVDDCTNAYRSTTTFQSSEVFSRSFVETLPGCESVTCSCTLFGATPRSDGCISSRCRSRPRWRRRRCPRRTVRGRCRPGYVRLGCPGLRAHGPCDRGPIDRVGARGAIPNPAHRVARRRRRGTGSRKQRGRAHSRASADCADRASGGNSIPAALIAFRACSGPVTGRAGLFFWSAIVIGVLADLEGLAASCILSSRQHDIPSFWHAVRLQRKRGTA